MPRPPSSSVHRKLAASQEIRKDFYDPKEQVSQKMKLKVLKERAQLFDSKVTIDKPLLTILHEAFFHF